MGTISLQQEKYGEAIDYYQRALKILQEMPEKTEESKWQQVVELECLSIVLQKSNNHEKAIVCLQKAIEHAGQLRPDHPAVVRMCRRMDELVDGPLWISKVAWVVLATNFSFFLFGLCKYWT